MEVQVLQALNPRRISRTVVTVLALSFIQTVVPTVVAPEIVTPKAQAVTETITPSTHASGTTILIPQGVASVTFEVVGAAGGKGGNDNAIGTNGTVAGRVITTLTVEPGDVIGLYGGNFGAAGANSASGNGGGAGGADTFPSTPYSIGGTYYNSMNFAGGNGGNAGSGGSSGGGGGAGAASIATVNYEIVAIAAGAGGGGGSGYGSNAAGNWNGTVAYNGTNFFGATGTSTVVCTNSNQNADGGGGGGGGGGFYGGAGGAAPYVVSECAGIAGAPGGNYLKSGGTSVTNDFISVTAGSLGYVKYTYEVASVSACAANTTTVDIYTVVKVTQTINCTWTVPSTVKVVDLFAVGGGGGGGGDGGSGGGGGGSKFRTSIMVTPSSSISVSVGYGGVGSSWGAIISGSAGQSTIVTLGSTTVTAAGGAAGTQGPGSGAAAGGGDSTSGGFAGGAGGTSPSCFNVGGTGKTGSTNYFYGNKSEYGGGGGGGACPNGAATTAAAGTSGGGSGGYAISGSVNAPATDGIDGTGGGGGGGLATGTGFKLNAGKGGSGVVLIRYATNSADEFPSGLASSVSARWTVDGLQVLDSSRKGWIDSSGNISTIANSAFTGSPYISTRGITDGAVSTGSSKTISVAKGGTGDKVNLYTLPTNYTMFHLTRYVSGQTPGRIISATAGNNLSGHHAGTYKCAHHEAWLTSSGCSNTNIYRWLLSTDQLRYYRADGVDVTLAPNDSTYLTNQALSGGVMGINNFWNNQPSGWEVADIVIFDRRLSHSEIILMENWFARVNGLTIDRPQSYSESDTAGVFSGQFYKGFYKNDFVVNDTFTVQAWLKPASSCATGTCSIFSSENVLVTKIDAGIFYYALDGTTARWVWVNTGVRVASNEWHHVALTKRLIGNQANAIDLYLDGQLAYTNTGNPYTGGATASGTTTDVVRAPTDFYYIGARTDTTRFYGAIDEFKFWSVARTGAEIAGDMHSNDTTSPNLSLYYDFNSDTLANSQDLQNLAKFGPGRSYMSAVTNMVFEDVKVVNTTGPYTTIRFPRTYITQFNGWKVPTGIETATTIVVGGGGGGGFGGAANAPAGAGGGGGVTTSLTQAFTTGATVTVKVGAGGLGGYDTSAASVRNGQSSVLGVGATLTALGGGGGGNLTLGAGAGGSSVATGGGSGGGSPSCTGSPLAPSGSITAGATVPSGYNGSGGVWGWGGSGGGARGAALNGVCSGNQAGTPGPGFFDPVTNIEYGKGGNADSYAENTRVITGYTTQNNGWGGIISHSTGNSTGVGYRGSSGAVIIRYITASKPTYTKPTTAYLNVGMTETFTTNVAQDSLTAMLTRTFKWESSTAGAAGPFTTIKQGTGPANAAFSWVPTDTSTTGSQYLYRLTVTDSDTAGLFITDSSTAFAVINRTLQMTGVTSIKKAINVSRNDTFTVVDGTPGYRYTLSPVIPGITLDTSTVGSPVIRISDTATIGTFLETLTVTDSVSASVQIPLTINISAPPSLTNTSEVIATGQVFSIDPSNSASYNRTTGAFSDISGAKHPISLPNGATFSTDSSGIVSLASSSSQYMSATGFTQLSKWTIETWIRLDGEVANYFCPLTSEFAPTNMSYLLCLDSTRTVYTGFHNGSWTYKRSTNVIPLNTWTHLVGTFDGTTINLYIDGVGITVKDSNTAAGTTPPQPSTDRIFLGKHYATAVGTTVSVSYGLARLYNTGFTQSDVLTNYNATKERFTSANLNQLKPSQKYGILNVESFTVTSGGDTKTVTFAVGNRTGITWDTSTVAGRINLSVQESLTPGTYYDTITVTDNFAQSTTLPITFSVSKADTITIIAGSARTQVFNNSPATNLPNFTISGLVSSDTGTVQRKYTGVDWTKPCAQGGGCEVGDTGPGGGTIFYISPTVINSASGVSSGGTYLEVAPINWSGLVGESTTAWAKASTSVTGTLSSIGAGAENTRLINTALTTNSVAAKVAADLTLNGKSDWFLPSTLELREMHDALYAPGLAGNLSIRNYWSSTQDPTLSSRADTYWFGGGGLLSPTDKLGAAITLRPIRAYSPDTITVTTVPTGADSYTVTVDTITMTTGSVSFYQNVIFQRSGLEISKARQAPLNVNLFGATFGLPFTISLLGGSGTGAVTESLTAGSTATGCAIAAHVLTSTTAGACNLQIKKAASRNYFTETATAIVYFLNWVINQPTNQVGGGATIGLNGESAVTRDPNAAPAVTSLSTYTGQAGVTQIQIHGSGFNHLDTGNIIVKFWRNVIASGFTVNAGDSVITVTIPAGATTGKVTVTTPNGLAVSEFPITITP